MRKDGVKVRDVGCMKTCTSTTGNTSLKKCKMLMR